MNMKDLRYWILTKELLVVSHGELAQFYNNRIRNYFKCNGLREPFHKFWRRISDRYRLELEKNYGIPQWISSPSGKYYAGQISNFTLMNKLLLQIETDFRQDTANSMGNLETFDDLRFKFNSHAKRLNRCRERESFLLQGFNEDEDVFEITDYHAISFIENLRK